jgi:hypothetical protein
VPRVKCPRCGTIVEHAAGFQPICPSCGYGAEAASAPAPVPAAAPSAPTPPPAAPPVPGAKPPPSQGIAIVGLVLNILVWPGLGSLVGGRSEGWAQGFLFLLGLLLTMTLILALVGIPLMIGMWVWAIVTGINLVKAAAPPPAAAAPT